MKSFVGSVYCFFNKRLVTYHKIKCNTEKNNFKQEILNQKVPTYQGNIKTRQLYILSNYTLDSAYPSGKQARVNSKNLYVHFKIEISQYKVLMNKGKMRKNCLLEHHQKLKKLRFFFIATFTQTCQAIKQFSIRGRNFFIYLICFYYLGRYVFQINIFLNHKNFRLPN